MNKKIIIIGLLLLIIAAIILVMLTAVKYEKVEITPNGTNIEVPANQTKYQGDFSKVKLWNWDKGILISYNVREENNPIKLGQLSFNAIDDIIKKGTSQNIDGFTCYVINADDLLEIQLFDFIKVNYKGKFYCIPLSNETTDDKILICSNDKDIALHMAKSVEYKNVYPNTENKNKSKIDNLTSDLKNVIPNNTKLEEAKSKIENITELENLKHNFIG